MNSGCAIVANKGMGAAPYLVQHGQNGCLYRNGKIMEAFASVEELIKNDEKRQSMGKAAYDTISKEWNAEVAADRTYKLIEELLAGSKRSCYKTGPLSKA
jgi:glycosyltransferase involved in cell wall biosynthesis